MESIVYVPFLNLQLVKMSFINSLFFCNGNEIGIVHYSCLLWFVISAVRIPITLLISKAVDCGRVICPRSRRRRRLTAADVAPAVATWAAPAPLRLAPGRRCASGSGVVGRPRPGPRRPQSGRTSAGGELPCATLCPGLLSLETGVRVWCLR